MGLYFKKLNQIKKNGGTKMLSEKLENKNNKNKENMKKTKIKKSKN